jgi:hypothetical protein
MPTTLTLTVSANYMLIYFSAKEGSVWRVWLQGWDIKQKRYTCQGHRCNRYYTRQSPPVYLLKTLVTNQLSIHTSLTNISNQDPWFLLTFISLYPYSYLYYLSRNSCFLVAYSNSSSSQVLINGQSILKYSFNVFMWPAPTTFFLQLLQLFVFFFSSSSSILKKL